MRNPSTLENPTALLLELRSRGLEVTLEPRPKRENRLPGRRIVVDGDEEQLTDDLRERIQANARGLADALGQLEAGGEIVNHGALPEPQRPRRAFYEPPDDPRREAAREARWARRWAT